MTVMSQGGPIVRFPDRRIVVQPQDVMTPGEGSGRREQWSFHRVVGEVLMWSSAAVAAFTAAVLVAFWLR
jgi:hypothetical protein